MKSILTLLIGIPWSGGVVTHLINALAQQLDEDFDKIAEWTKEYEESRKGEENG